MIDRFLEWGFIVSVSLAIAIMIIIAVFEFASVYHKEEKPKSNHCCHQEEK